MLRFSLPFFFSYFSQTCFIISQFNSVRQPGQKIRNRHPRQSYHRRYVHTKRSCCKYKSLPDYFLYRDRLRHEYCTGLFTDWCYTHRSCRRCIGNDTLSDLQRNRLLDCNSKEKMITVSNQKDNYNGPIIELPKTTCVSVSIHFCSSQCEAPAYYQKLNDYTTAHNLIICNFSKEITMIDYKITNDTSQFVTEVQIPVKVSNLSL